MRISVWASTFRIGCLTVLLALEPAAAESVQEKVQRLCKQAGASPTQSLADQILDQAETELGSFRSTMTSLEYGFQHNEIKRTRGLVCITLWQRNEANTALRDEGRRWLEEALAGYDGLAEQGEEKADAIEQAVDITALAQHSAYKAAIGDISRANYKKAWTEYLLGIATDDPDERETRFISAYEGFLRFTAKGFRNHPIVADCLIGQAQCLCELGRYPQVIADLDPDPTSADPNQGITPDNTTPEAFKRITALRMKACQALSRHLQVEEYARQYFDALPENERLDATELGMAIVRAESLVSLVGNAELADYDETYRRRLAETRELVCDYGSEWRQKLAASLAQADIDDPLVCLEAARRYLQEGQYEQAHREIERGLLTPDQQTGNDGLRADLRYLGFVAYWNQKSWRDAHRAAVDFLKHHPQHARAAEVCDQAIRSGIWACQSQPALEVAEFVESLEYMEETFPQVPEVRRAPLYRAQLLLQGDEPAAEQVLEAIGPESPVYQQAQWMLAQVRFRQAEAARQANSGTGPNLKRLYERVAEALTHYADHRRAGMPDADPARAQSVAELAAATAERLLYVEGADPNAVRMFIDRIEPRLSVTSSSQARMMAVHAEIDLSTGDLQAGITRLNDVLRLKSSDPAVAATLMHIASMLEQIRASAAKDDPQGQGSDQTLARVYLFLVEHVRTSADAAMREREPAARLCLAQCLARLGRHSEAIPHYEWCVSDASAKKSQAALVGLATAYERTAKHEQALQRWRELYRGLPRRTDGWIEAAYHLIRCHINLGHRDHARDVLAHFMTLCPRSELGQWSERFEVLEKECSVGEARSEVHLSGGTP